MSSPVTELDERGRLLLAAAIGESPESIMTVHRLRRHLCRTVIDGPPERPRAVLVAPLEYPDEPSAYGEDPRAIWTLLKTMESWSCVNASWDIAPSLASLIEGAIGCSCMRTEEIYYQLERPVVTWPHAAVRRLTMSDVPLMEAATESLNMFDWRFGSAAAQIDEGLAAGAIVNNELVAVAFIGGRGERLADVGIATRPDWRNRGFSTAAAALVCADIQAAHQTPVWGTSVENIASQKVAAKLGFKEVSRSVFLCVS